MSTTFDPRHWLLLPMPLYSGNIRILNIGGETGERYQVMFADHAPVGIAGSLIMGDTEGVHLVRGPWKVSAGASGRGSLKRLLRDNYNLEVHDIGAKDFETRLSLMYEGIRGKILASIDGVNEHGEPVEIITLERPRPVEKKG